MCPVASFMDRQRAEALAARKEPPPQWDNEIRAVESATPKQLQNELDRIKEPPDA